MHKNEEENDGQGSSTRQSIDWNNLRLLKVDPLRLMRLLEMVYVKSFKLNSRAQCNVTVDRTTAMIVMAALV